MVRTLAICLLFAFSNQYAQRVNWQIQWGQEKSFIENKGQFEALYKIPVKEPVLYAYEGSKEAFFFTNRHLIIRLAEFKKKKERTPEELQAYLNKKQQMTAEEYKQYERNEFRKSFTEEFIVAEWLNANPNTIIIPENQTSYYHSYTFKSNHELTNINYIPSFEKITFKNIYPYIDIVYEFHPNGGIKYSILIHQGGELKNIKLKYSHPIHLDNNGNILIKTNMGDIIEHAPITLLAENNQPINSSFIIQDNTIMFNIQNIQTNHSIIIDPWVVTPFSNSSNGVWECETDANGNAYIIGDGMISPQKLKKIQYCRCITMDLYYFVGYKRILVRHSCNR